MKSELNEYFNEFIDGLEAEDNFKKAMKYVLISDGKLIRPLVFFSVLNEYNISGLDYLNVAAAIEMLHTYSLIHDDLPAMDDDDFRRGRLTLHKKYNEATAILVGDSLLTHSFGVAINNDLLTDKQKVDIINLFVKSGGSDGGMINGQILDLYFENKKASESDLREIHHQKTAQLLYLPMACALIVSNNEKDLDKVLKLASVIGLLYQVRDDYLDRYGYDIGKPINSDRDNLKSTYVDLYTKLELEQYIEQLINEAHLIADELGYSEKFHAIVRMFGERDK